MTILRTILVLFGSFCVVSSSCTRDEDRVRRNDPTRTCRKSCTTDSQCSGDLKHCVCDNYCGKSCFNPDAKCDNITGTLVNGEITFNRKTPMKYNTQATHVCNQGYRIQGKEQRICYSTKKWSHEAPKCIRSCPEPAKVGSAFASSRTRRDIYEAGVSVTYICQTGYTASGNPTRVCQSSYTWSTLGLMCFPVSCGTPPRIINGDYTPKGKTTFGSTVTYSCDKGFSTGSGSVISICDASANWNKEAPTCTRVPCPPPPSNIKHGKVIQDGGHTPWEYEDSIGFLCNDGYLINGTLSKTRSRCDETGSWGEPPICEADLNADFDKSFEGYSVLPGGSFTRDQYDQPLGPPSFGVLGTGIVQSVPYPMSPLQKVCLQVDYQNKLNTLVAKVQSYNVTVELMKFPASSSWTSEKLWLVNPRTNHAEVLLQFLSNEDVGIDNIKVLHENECAGKPVPKYIGPTTEAPAQTTTPASSTTSEVHKSTTAKAEGTSATSSLVTSQHTTTIPSSNAVTIPGVPGTTVPLEGAVTTPGGNTSAGQGVPGRNAPPGGSMTTPKTDVTTTASTQGLRNLLIGFAAISAAILVLVILFWFFCLRKDRKKIIDSPSTLLPANSGPRASSDISNPSPRSSDELIETDVV